MKLQNLAIAAVLALMATLIGSLPSWADEDPYPNLQIGDEIPGTRIDSPRNMSTEDWHKSEAYINQVCPPLTQRRESRVSSYGKIVANSSWCVKNYRSPDALDALAAQQAFQEKVRAAQKAAEDESRRWNEANPGKQKCVQYGPIAGPNGAEASGGVCANPVSVPAESVGEGDVSSSSPVPGSTPSQDASSVAEGDIASSTSGSAQAKTSSSPAAPIPEQSAPIRGNGYPFTVILEGQVGLSGCPAPYNAANGLINAARIGTFTECWPATAWAANRIGGETWQMFKATGGTYDINAVLDKRKKVDLLRAKAKEVAEAAARDTPGIDRCSSWAGFGESGKECAYAFIDPKDVKVPSSSSEKVTSSSGTVSPKLSLRSSTKSADADSSSSSNSVGSSSSTTTSIAVGLDATEIKGSSLVIAEMALEITPDKVEASSISDLAKGFTEVDTIQRSLFQWFPRDRELNYKVESLTPNVCLASSWRVRITNPGLCQVEILITDSEGNEYELIKKIRRYF